MAATAPFATPAILKALRQRLSLVTHVGRGSDVPTTPALYTEAAVPTTATSGEYLTIGPFTEVPQNTMGSGPKWGRSVSTAIKVVSYSSDVAPGYALMTTVITALDGQELDVDGFRTGWVELEVVADAYVELVAGVPVRHFPMIFRIHVHES